MAKKIKMAPNIDELKEILKKEGLPEPPEWFDLASEGKGLQFKDEQEMKSKLLELSEWQKSMEKTQHKKQFWYIIKWRTVGGFAVTAAWLGMWYFFKVPVWAAIITYWAITIPWMAYDLGGLNQMHKLSEFTAEKLSAMALNRDGPCNCPSCTARRKKDEKK
jgi:hypothetical protein